MVMLFPSGDISRVVLAISFAGMRQRRFRGEGIEPLQRYCIGWAAYPLTGCCWPRSQSQTRPKGGTNRTRAPSSRIPKDSYPVDA